MDMTVATAAASAADRIAPISRQIWEAKYRLKAADGTPYIAANRYQYQTQYKNTPSIPFFIGRDGKPISDGGTRETLMAWPINDARNAVEIPVMIRDGLLSRLRTARFTVPSVR